MFNYLLPRLKLIGLAAIALSVVVFLLIQFQRFIQPWQAYINQAPYLLLGLCFILAAQFNRSRLALLSIMWLLIYTAEQSVGFYSQWLAGHETEKTLFVSLFLVAISFIQDRGLFSLHSVKRIILISCLAGITWVWLTYYPLLQQLPLVKQMPPQLTKFIVVEFPLGILFLTLLIRLILKPSAIMLCIVISFILWVGHQLALLSLNWSQIISLLAIYYIVVVMVDSYFLAYRDELTGLPTRRALNHLALSLARKYSVAMLDIDHFKKFNDTYGHDIGDQVLKLVAKQLQKCRGGARIFRYGGEEFTVVFPGKDAEHAQLHLDKLRQAIADYKMIIRQPIRKDKKARGKAKASQEKSVTITISIGVASKQRKQSFAQVLKAADEALYRAKGKGRNNVSL
jgi:diguanylate cyclase (GGDEF)-like protein